MSDDRRNRMRQCQPDRRWLPGSKSSDSALKARPLRARPDVKLLDAGTDGMAVMFAARGCTSLIVVDCCKTGVEPGSDLRGPGA